MDTGEKRSEKAAYQYTDLKGDAPDMQGYIAFDREAMDSWWEEDEPNTIEPCDPYTRIDMPRVHTISKW